MKNNNIDNLAKLIEKREENISFLSKWSDADLNDLTKRLTIARDIATENDNFKSYKFLCEKLSKVYKAEDLKYSFSDDANDWIHW
jgi:hypothetical protein